MKSLQVSQQQIAVEIDHCTWNHPQRGFVKFGSNDCNAHKGGKLTSQTDYLPAE